MARTRSKPAGASAKDDASKSTTAKITLEAQTGNNPNVFILPKRATPDARIVTLPHPRRGIPSRYLVCPETGVYEFTKIAAPKSTPRSWLIETRTIDAGGSKSTAHVASNSDLFLATATDPLFLILPSLCESKAAKGSDDKKRLFLSSEDYFDKLPEEFSHLSEVLRTPSTRKLFESRLGEVCDTVDAGDENMYRLNEEKLSDAMLRKARRMCDGGLPLSMEEKFVKKALEAPILLQKRAILPATGEQAQEAISGLSTPLTDSNDSQSTTTTDTNDSTMSQPSTAATSFSETPAESDGVVAGASASPEIHNLQRLKVAIDFICSSYLSPSLGAQIQRQLTSENAGGLDFKPLHAYLAQLAKLRADAVAARSQGDFSRKRAHDEEEDEARLEKKRKLEEEKKKKASESHGVRKLKKVNTSGMMKLSSFFQKK
ncbi:ribonuclease H2, subunit B [Sarocladium strictum]